MEPPGSHVRGRPQAAGDVQLSAGPLRLAATAASATLAITSSGEVVLLAALLGAAAADLAAASAAVVALVALAVRWGSTSLDAIAGAQAVLGPGATVGSAASVAAAWCSSAALVLAAPRGWPALGFGAAAALAVAGPSPADVGDVVLRVGATAAGIALTVAAGHRLPGRPARTAALVLAGLALLLALPA